MSSAYGIFLLIKSNLSWDRKEGQIQSILWINLLEIVSQAIFIADILSGFKISSSIKDYNILVQVVLIFVLDWSQMGSILSTLIFCLEYDKTSRLMPHLL